MAIWHHPRFNSGTVHGNDAEVGPLWNALYDNGAELVIDGHEHVYERFAPQRPDGTADPAFGIRQITVGTGGAGTYTFGTTQPNSQVRAAPNGVLKLTLRPGGLRLELHPGRRPDVHRLGSGTCHDKP